MDGNGTPLDAAAITPSEAGIRPPSLEAVPNPRQQRKIMVTLLTDAPGVLSAPDVTVSNSERATFLERVRKGEIARPQVDKMLSRINTPLGTDPNLLLEQATHTLGDLSPNRQGRAIIAHLVKGNMDLRDQLTPEDIAAFFQANPLPSDFEQTVGADFLSELEALNGPDKTAEYKDSMLRMMRTVYGKRMDYWEQYKLLQKDAQAGTSEPKLPTYQKGVPNQGNNLNDPSLMGPWKKG